MKKLMGALVGLATLGVAGAANATILVSNDAAFNFLGAPQDGANITTDVTNGLDWLDWSLTLNRSFNNVSADLATGQPLDGWRYATGQEFLNLLFSAGVLSTEIDVFILGPSPSSLVTLQAALGSGSFTGESLGLFIDSQSTGTRRLGGICLASSAACARTVADTPGDPSLFYSQGFPEGTPNTRVGSALVRAAAVAVPEPSTFLLFGVGLAGLAGFRWRSRQVVRN